MMARGKGKAHARGLTGAITPVPSTRTSLRATGSNVGAMDVNTRATGSIAKCTGRASSRVPTAASTKELSKKTREQGKGFYRGQMGGNMKADFSTISSTARGPIHSRTI